MAEKTTILKIVVSGFGEASRDLEFLTTETAKLGAEKKKMTAESTAAARAITAEEGSIEKLRAQTALLRQEANNMRAVTEKEIQTRTQLTKQIADNTTKIREHDRAMSGSSTLVGEYERGFSGAFKNIGKSLADTGLQLISFAALAGYAAQAISKIKDAFFSTDQGMGILRQWTEAAKTFFAGVVNEHEKGALKSAMAAGKELNAIRVGDRKDALEVVRLETEINLLRFKSSDATRSQAEQLMYLNKLQEKENELILFKKKDIKEEVEALERLWMTRRNDGTLMDLINAKRVEFDRLEGERSFKIEARRSGLIAKELKEREDANKRIIEGQKKLQDEVDKINHEASIKNINEVDEYIKLATEEAEMTWQFALDFQRTLFKQNQKDAKLAWDEMLKRNDDEVEAERAKQKKITEAKQAIIKGTQEGSDAVFAAKRNRLQAEMEAELSNENLTEQGKLEIRKKYAREQQKIDIKQAIINGALAIAKIFAEVTPINPLSWLAVAMVGVQTAIQVATIKAQKFASGGRIFGGVRVTPDSRGDDTLIVAKQGEVILNETHQKKIGAAAFKRAGVPGFADSGIIGSLNYSPGLPFDIETFINRMVNGINDKQVILNVNKVNSAIAESNFINQSNKI